MPTNAKSWRTYEEVAAQILADLAAHLGLEGVEGKQSVIGLRSGTSWEIDAKGIVNEGFLIIECRRTRSRQKQEDIAALAYRIQDTGAAGGIIISPLPLQAGAKRVAEAEGIVHVQIPAGSSPEQYIVRLLKLIAVRVPPDSIAPSHSIVSIRLETVDGSEKAH